MRHSGPVGSGRASWAPSSVFRSRGGTTYHTEFAREFRFTGNEAGWETTYRGRVVHHGRQLAEAAGLEIIGDDLPYLIARTWAEMGDVHGVYWLDGERVMLRGLVDLISPHEAELLCEIEPELQCRIPWEGVGDKTPYEVALFRLLREFAGWLADECSRRVEPNDDGEA